MNTKRHRVDRIPTRRIVLLNLMLTSWRQMGGRDIIAKDRAKLCLNGMLRIATFAMAWSMMLPLVQSLMIVPT